MSRDYPDLIDPWKAADGKRVFQGTMQLSRMPRLALLLESVSGEAGFSARFGYDRQRNVVIDLAVEADLILVCQRSLLAYTEPVRRRSELAVIEKLAEQDALPSNYDPVLVENHRLSLLELVEDELLLGIPQIPRNPAVKEVEMSTDGDVRTPSAKGDEPLQRPFAGLADLMKAKAQD
jgi:uncharacterized protein